MLFLKCLSLQLQQKIATVVGSLTTTEINAICCFEREKKKKKLQHSPRLKGQSSRDCFVLTNLTIL